MTELVVRLPKIIEIMLLKCHFLKILQTEEISNASNVLLSNTTAFGPTTDPHVHRHSVIAVIACSVVTANGFTLFSLHLAKFQTFPRHEK